MNELSPSLFFFYLLKTVFSIYFSFKMLGDADKISSIARIWATLWKKKRIEEKEKKNLNHTVKKKDLKRREKKKSFRGPCESRTHDLRVISTTLYRLS